MPKADIMFYGSQAFQPAGLLQMLSKPPKDMSHQEASDTFLLKWPEASIYVMRLGAPQREEHLKAFAASGADNLLARVKIVEVLGLRWEGSDAEEHLETLLMSLCDVMAGYFLRDGQIVGPRGPVPL